MYTDHFNLKEKPFALEPDPRFYLLQGNHEEAMASLLYSTDEQEGWALLLGEAGTGKTVTVMALMQNLDDRIIPAVLTNPTLEPLDFFNLLALELDLPGPFATKGQFLMALGQFMGRCRNEGQSILVIIDEAQNLSLTILEELRLLTNLDRSSPTVLNIFLVGQLTVLRVLKRAKAGGLIQRVRRYRLINAMTLQETANYVAHRVQVAGGDPAIFEPEALGLVHRAAKGVPLLTNTLCDESLLLAFSGTHPRVTAQMVEQAAQAHPAISVPPPDEKGTVALPANPAPVPTGLASPPRDPQPTLIRAGDFARPNKEETAFPSPTAPLDLDDYLQEGLGFSDLEDTSGPVKSRQLPRLGEKARKPPKTKMAAGRVTSSFRKRLVILILVFIILFGIFWLLKMNGMYVLKSQYYRLHSYLVPTQHSDPSGLQKPDSPSGREPVGKAKKKKVKIQDWGMVLPAPESSP